MDHVDFNVENYKRQFYVTLSLTSMVLKLNKGGWYVIRLETVRRLSDDESVTGTRKRFVEKHMVEKCDGELLLVLLHDDVMCTSVIVNVAGGNSSAGQRHVCSSYVKYILLLSSNINISEFDQSQTFSNFDIFKSTLFQIQKLLI